MPTPQSPLYPKISSVYNKILQLAMAIVLLLLVLNFWQSNSQRQNQSINQQFSQLTRLNVQQMAIAIANLWQPSSTSKVAKFIEQSAQTDWIKDIVLYDETGQAIVESANSHKISDYFGVLNQHLDQSDIYYPFVMPVKNNNFSGYLRVMVNKQQLLAKQKTEARQQQNIWRLMILFTLVAGFLLTRGLSRFSRQGYRLAKPRKAA